MNAKATEQMLCGELASQLMASLDFAQSRNAVLDQEASIEIDVLHRTIRQLNHFADFAAVPLHRINLGGLIQWVNQAELDLLGYARDEYIGRHIAEIHADPNIIADILRCLANGEEIKDRPAILKTKSGEIREVLISACVIWEGDRFIQAQCVTRDITAQRQAEMESRQAQRAAAEVTRQLVESHPAVSCNGNERKMGHDGWRYLAAVVESSDDAIITKDLDGVITSWNKSAERLFGYTAEEAIGKPVTILIPPNRQDEEQTILSRLRKGQRIEHYETIRRRKDGRLLDISLTVSPVRDVQGRIIGASKTARDISERKATELELLHMRDQLACAKAELEKRVAQRTKSLREVIAQMEEFSYSVSHDLRAPVRAMKAYALAALEDYGDRLDLAGRDYLDRIVRGSTRMERLIHDVLTYTRLARAEFRVQPVSLERLLPDIIQQYPEMQLPHARILVTQPLHVVMAHEPSLMQALSNILSNGVKFVSAGNTPRIHVWSEARREIVRIWIEDNGIGIPPEYQRRIFGMFERAHQDKAFEGTGIGLAIVRKAVEKMSGRVGVESDGTSGSRFWMELPSANVNS